MNIGDAVWQEMQKQGDTAIHDSVFINVSKFQTEIGFGKYFDYYATNAWGSWSVTTQPVAQGLLGPIDRRDLLPVRQGATPYPKRSLSGVSLYVCHYTAGPASQRVEQVAQYQVGPTSQLPFPSIAYHMFAERDGSLYLCQDLDRRTWGSGGTYQGKAVNDIGIHACYAGDLAPNTSQVAALHQGRVFCEGVLGHSLLVRGHSNDDATQCPGPKVQEWLGQI